MRTMKLMGNILPFMMMLSVITKAQFPYTETFRNNTATGVTYNGSPNKAFLTSGVIDPPGEGWLRLTNGQKNQSGVAFCSVPLRSNQGMIAEFEYCMYDPTTKDIGDGITFFLYDASISTSQFHSGAYGGSLGYAQKTGIDGVSKGYLGIGLDAYGNYSNPTEGRYGGSGFAPNSVTLRGPGDGSSLTNNYPFIVAQKTLSLAQPFEIVDRTPGRAILPGSSGYRKVRIELEPKITGNGGYYVTVKITTGGATPIEHLVLNKIAFDYKAPSVLKFGFTAGTGDATNIHEIRNVVIDVFEELQPPVSNDVSYTICSNTEYYFDPTANDITPNDGENNHEAGSNINKAAIDFDNTTPGLQQSITIEGKGNFTANSDGIVKFTPDPSFTNGTVQVKYYVSDVYGKQSNGAFITINVNSATPDLLQVNSLQTTCAPGSINLTATPAVWTLSGTGGSIAYFKDALATQPLTNPALVNESGRYYIQATGTNGCSVLKPVDVTITSTATAPLVENGFNCGAGSVTLITNGAAPGEDYKWYDNSTATTPLQTGGSTFNTPSLSATRSYWVTKYNTTSGSCESAKIKVDANINSNPIQANAGDDKILSSGATTVTLNGNIPASGEFGLWTVESSTSSIFIIEPDTYNASIQNLPDGTYSLKWTVRKGTCTSSDIMNIRVGTILPVKISSFNVKPVLPYAHLQWTTIKEENNAGYNIERSLDGKNFATIIHVNGCENYTTYKQYEYKDDISAISTAIIYYRLKQIDINGNFNYSQVVSINNATEESWGNFLPNPFSNKIWCKVNISQSGRFLVRILNSSGQTVRMQNVSVEKGMNNISITNLSVLAKGIYYIEIWKGGSIIKTTKAVK